MKRIESNGHDNHRFTEGDPIAGREATVVSAAWLNDVQEALMALIEAAGLTPGAPGTEGVQKQLLEALNQRYEQRNRKGQAGGYASLDASGDVPDAQLPARLAPEGYLFRNRRVFTASRTWTRPAWCRAAWVEVIGGGGGGGKGGYIRGNQGGGGGGGGGGGYRRGYFLKLEETTYQITIGWGGRGGTARIRPGSRGGTTSFDSLLSAAGGGGGQGGVDGNGGVLVAAGGQGSHDGSEGGVGGMPGGIGGAGGHGGSGSGGYGNGGNGGKCQWDGHPGSRGAVIVWEYA